MNCSTGIRCRNAFAAPAYPDPRRSDAQGFPRGREHGRHVTQVPQRTRECGRTSAGRHGTPGMVVPSRRGSPKVTNWRPRERSEPQVDPDPDEPLEKIPGHLLSSAAQLAGVALLPLSGPPSRASAARSLRVTVLQDGTAV